MRQLAPCAALLFLTACSGNVGFQPFDAGAFGVPTGGGITGGGTTSGGSNGGSTGGGLCGVADGVGCTLDAGAAAGGSGICCGGGCTDSQSDPLNCGGCLQACPTGASCLAGSCTGTDGGVVSCQQAGCAAGLVCVGTLCLSTACSAASGNACALDSGVAGICCGNGCTDPLSDDLNCLSCNTQCSSGDFCSGSSGCQPVPVCGPAELGITCPADDAGTLGICCPQGCAATLSDPSNCGSCGAICPNGASCAAGSCAGADAGPVSCFNGGGSCPTGTGCVGSYCLAVGCGDGGSGGACLFGVDVAGNPATGVCCAGSCVDLKQNPNDCSGCGLTCLTGVCAPGPNACLPPADADGGVCPNCTGAQTCVGTQCVDNACGSLSDLCQNTDAGDIGVCCPDIFGDSVCVDFAFDPSNCGGCGSTCPPGQGCNDGVCGGSQGSCGAGTVGMYCNFDAGPTFLCCPGRNCTDVRTDVLNCGGCSNECPDGTYCIDGNCLATSCGADSGAACQLVDGGIGGCCNAACLDELHDPANCGSCQNPCSAPNGSCDFGVCGVAACTQTSLGVPCPADGVAGLCCSSGCADTASDPANCGNCGIVCPGDGGCIEGSCR